MKIVLTIFLSVFLINTVIGKSEQSQIDKLSQEEVESLLRIIESNGFRSTQHVTEANAQIFYSGYELIYEYPDNFEVFQFYITLLSDFSEFYDEKQKKQMLIPFFELFPKMVIKDELLTKQYEITVFEVKITDVINSFNALQKKSELKKFAKALDQRDQYFKQKEGEAFKDHAIIENFKIRLDYKFYYPTGDPKDYKSILALWDQSNTSEKERYLRFLEFNQESNAWVKSLLQKKKSKRITKAILEFLASNIDEAEENKGFILEFIANNQRFPYITIANEYLGEDVVDAYLGSFE